MIYGNQEVIKRRSKVLVLCVPGSEHRMLENWELLAQVLFAIGALASIDKVVSSCFL